MSDVAVSLTFKDTLDGVIKSILLENVGDTNINLSSQITRHPIPSGDMVADHSFKQPANLSLNGSFSSNGRKGLVFQNQQFSLIEVQDLFERIKDEGILCNIVKVKVNEDEKPMFSIRHDMALQNITWNEKINSLDFNFSFTQIMLVDINEYDVDTSDMFLPDVTDPNVLSFTESPLFDKEGVVKAINNAVDELKVAEPEFLRFLSSWLKSGLIAGAIGVGVTVGVAAILGTILATATATGIGAVVAIVAATAYFIYRIVKFAKESAGLKIRKFRKYKSQRKNEEEGKRYIQMIDDLVKEFDALNSQIAVYNLANDGQQQCLLTIDDEYYCFTFTKNNVDDSKYKLSILDLDNNLISSIEDVSSSAIQSIDGCNSNTAILVVNNIQVFLMNPKDSNERTNDLTENYILISKLDMGQFSTIVDECIKRYLVY